jgi:hypothetical protein
MNKLNQFVIAILISFVCLMIFCSEENKDKENLDNKDTLTDGQESIIDETELNEDSNMSYSEAKSDNKDFDPSGFFTEAQKKYEEYHKYLNSFTEQQAPSGLTFFKKTIELGSFLNEQGKTHPEVVKTETYKKFYKLFIMLDKLVTKSDEIEGTSDIDEKETYINLYNHKLTNINKLFDEIKTSVENKE